MESKPLSINELKDAFFSLKINKSPDYDEISFNVVKKCFGELYDPLKFTFELSFEKGIFTDYLKIARVTPVFKGGDRSKLGNYRQISMLPCFSKILERIMHDGIYKYLQENKILFLKQFGFQFGHSNEHRIIQSVDQIFEAFENNLYTLSVIVDLSKAFDAVDYTILLKTFKLYGIRGNKHNWIKNFLSNRKQYIEIDPTTRTSLELVKCGVPQGSILTPLLFLLYAIDLKNASRLLDPIMFADDTNLFYNHKNIHCLFSDVNKELTNIKKWFVAYKLSLNVAKTKYSSFHKPSKKDNVPLQLSNLSINNHKIKREESIKFLGVLLDENVTWKKHLKYIENKCAKSIGLL